MWIQGKLGWIKVNPKAFQGLLRTLSFLMNGAVNPKVVILCAQALVNPEVVILRTTPLVNPEVVVPYAQALVNPEVLILCAQALVSLSFLLSPLFSSSIAFLSCPFSTAMCQSDIFGSCCHFKDPELTLCCLTNLQFSPRLRWMTHLLTSQFYWPRARACLLFQSEVNLNENVVVWVQNFNTLYIPKSALVGLWDCMSF